MTGPQRRALEYLMADGPLTPWELARRMWPDSPGWQRRSRRGAGAGSGALGATMPMKAGTLLGRLHREGWVSVWGSTWQITRSGRSALEAQP